MHDRCCARLLVVRGAAVEKCHQVAVGGAGGGKFVVAVLEVLVIEELLLELGNALPESADFVGSAPVVRSRSRASRILRRRSLSLRRAAIRGFVGCVVTVGFPGSGRVLASRWWAGRGARSGGCGARSARLPRSL